MSAIALSAFVVASYSSPEEKKQLDAQLIAWSQDVSELKKFYGKPFEYMELFTGTSEIETVLDSAQVIRWIRGDLEKDGKNFLVTHSRIDHTIRGIGVFSDDYDQLDYLQSAPLNLNIEPNRLSGRCLKGVGSSIVKEGINLSRNTCMEVSTTSSSKLFYEKLGFVSRDGSNVAVLKLCQ
jgi:hypothetical protein